MNVPPIKALHWWRQDRRLHDNPVLGRSLQIAQHGSGAWLGVTVDDPAQDAPTAWGFARRGPHRRRWEAMTARALRDALHAHGQSLVCLRGDPVEVLHQLWLALDRPVVVCEDVAAPEEQAQVRALRALGVTVQTVWCSTLWAPEDLPAPPEKLPDTFTPFRQALERHGRPPAKPLPVPATWPMALAPDQLAQALARWPNAPLEALQIPEAAIDPRTTVAWDTPAFGAGEEAALAHVARYVARGLPHHYFDTRNGLLHTDDSTKWSPWLATGALSARQAWAAVAAFETTHGASKSSGWIRFELLWRDHFRWLHRKHGARLYRAGGLHPDGAPRPRPRPDALARWCEGRTCEPLVDAGMRELAATGFLSNRLRQIVASYLIHDLQGDWRAGAAWFESRLIDFDVHSNQGNWLYLSGHGTDPRGHRRFDPVRQAQQYDPDGAYRRRWAKA